MKLEHLRAEIERLRSQIRAQRSDIRKQERAGISTKSTAELLARLQTKVDDLCEQQDKLVGEQRLPVSEHWKFPEGGKHGVAIPSEFYEALTDEIDNFFGRPLNKYSHYFVFDSQTYAVFTFKEKDDALKFMTAFEGEPFDPRDAGSGSHWTRWYKGRNARRNQNRSLYDFRKLDD